MKVVNAINYSYTPYMRIKDDVRTVMFDVILSLIPAALMSFLAYGISSFLVITTCVLSAVLTEIIFSKIFFKESNSIKNLSAVITGILLAFTLAPFTPLYVAAFGAAMAIIFGKLIFGGLGKNQLNPAVVGREFMTIFFSVVMSSPIIWFSQNSLKAPEFKLFSTLNNSDFSNYLDKLVLNPSGAIGEASVLALILGGIYLLAKNRISWHTPVALFGTLFIALFFVKEAQISMGGLMLAGIFMATDMPSSPTYSWGKFYYGLMIAVTMVVFWKFNIQFETLSYSIIVLNIFSKIINKIFRPVVFGYKLKLFEKVLQILFLTVVIIIFSILWAMLHTFYLIPYVVFVYIFVTVMMFIFSKDIK